MKNSQSTFNNEVVLKISTEFHRPQPSEKDKRARKKSGMSYFMATGKKEYLLVR